MAGFLSGPAAQLVGASMQAIGVGIPVGETSAKVINGLRDCGLPVPPKTWFKRKDAGGREHEPRLETGDERSSRSIYDKLESHINGMMQVVKPAIELKKLLRENCCKSAERPRRAGSRSPNDTLKFYTPQKCSSSACKLFDRQQSPSPKRKTPTKSRSKCNKRPCTKRDSSSDQEEQCCMYCSRSRSLLKLPCGRFICTKCHEIAAHAPDCKQCKAADNTCAYPC